MIGHPPTTEQRGRVAHGDDHRLHMCLNGAPNWPLTDPPPALLRLVRATRTLLETRAASLSVEISETALQALCAMAQGAIARHTAAPLNAAALTALIVERYIAGHRPWHPTVDEQDRVFVVADLVTVLEVLAG